MPKKSTTAQQRAREAARAGGKYTRELRAAKSARADDNEFGGHEFEYETRTDLFRCSLCRVYEVMARADDGTVTTCTGLAGYGGDPDRVYLLLTLEPELPGWISTSLSWQIRETGIGKSADYGWSSGKGQLLVESAPGVVDDLVRRIEHMTFDIAGQRRPAVAIPGRQGPPAVITSIDNLTAQAGQAVIEEHRAAYIAEYGEP